MGRNPFPSEPTSNPILEQLSKLMALAFLNISYAVKQLSVRL